MPLDPSLLRQGHVVVDLVYEPVETGLLAAARSAGARTVDGVGMLVHQAAHAFTLWTGVEAPVAEMGRAAREAITRENLNSRRCPADGEGAQVHLEEGPVALQGTIDTFELTEVVRLLAAGSKTGVLRLEGSRGSGRLWVDGGQGDDHQVDHAPRAESLAEAMFELLRFEDGHFTFASDELANPAGEPTELDGILVDAEAQLAEWREIEVVVPTTRAMVTLRRELTRADVVLDKQRWRLVAAIGGGITVATLGDAMDLGELPVSRAVKDLIELGVVDLDTTVADDPVADEAVPTSPRAGRLRRALPRAGRPGRAAFGTEPADAPPVFIGTDPVLSIPDEETNAARAQLDEFAAGFGLSDPAIYESSAVDASPNGADGSLRRRLDGVRRPRRLLGGRRVRRWRSPRRRPRSRRRRSPRRPARSSAPATTRPKWPASCRT